MNLHFFLWGCAGAFVDQLLHWVAIKNDPRFPTYAKKVKFWIISLLSVLAGGVITLAYVKSTGEMKELSQMAIGFTGIALFKKMYKAGYKEPPVAGPTPAVKRATISSFLTD